MKVKELRDLSDLEISKKIDDSKDELFKLRFQLATGQLDNPKKIKECKRRIARLKTVETQRMMGIRQA